MMKLIDLINLVEDNFYNGLSVKIDLHEVRITIRRTVQNGGYDLLPVPDNEWKPDWTKIKYDHLRMAADGRWHSWNTDNELVFERGEWVCLQGADAKCNSECHITYKHPFPANAVYTRFSGEIK